MKATKTQSDRLASTSGRARGKHMDAYSFRWLAGNPPLRGTRLQFGEGHSVLGELLRRGSDPVGGPGRKAAFWSRRFVVSRRSERGIWSANNQILSVLYIYILTALTSRWRDRTLPRGSRSKTSISPRTRFEAPLVHFITSTTWTEPAPPLNQRSLSWCRSGLLSLQPLSMTSVGRSIPAGVTHWSDSFRDDAYGAPKDRKAEYYFASAGCGTRGRRGIYIYIYISHRAEDDREKEITYLFRWERGDCGAPAASRIHWAAYRTCHWPATVGGCHGSYSASVVVWWSWAANRNRV